MSNNRDDQQQQQQQQQTPYQHQQQQIPQQRTLNPYSDSFTFNPSNSNTNYYNSNNSNNSLYYNSNIPTQPNAQQQYLQQQQPTVNNYYQLQQQQQQLYQPQAQSTYTQFQTFVPAQPPSLQQFSEPIVPTEPDEFIIDLLRKPQERLFLLKLELEIESFIKEGESKLRLDFPGMNSYQRLMVHRLAPYYKLNHYHDAMRKAVYVCKTFITELPAVRLQDVRLNDKEDSSNINDTNTNTPNNELTASAEENTLNTEPPPQFKIMRRSAGSSPSNSNNSKDNKDDPQSRKNMTFEERKSAYEEARARIFQNLESSGSSQQQQE